MEGSVTQSGNHRTFPINPLRAAGTLEGSAFRTHHYHRHNCRRQEHLASLGLDLINKSVLEVGAGIGDHTTFFLDRGCSVVSLESRPENCRLFVAAIQSHPHAARSRLIQGDVESLDQLITDYFELVYCYGLLYHLRNPEGALTSIANRCRDLLLLETCVSFGTGEALNPVLESRSDPTQSFEGTGCRPTRQWVFNRLKSLFTHVYVPRTQPAHEEFPLDWTASWPSNLLSRAVFVASRLPIASPLLLDHLPDRQSWSDHS